MEITNYENKSLFLSGDKVFTEETLSLTITASAGSIADTTSYPVATQNENTLKMSIDGGTAQTITFNSEEDRIRLVVAVGDITGGLDGLTFIVNIDNGGNQTVTFATADDTRDEVLAKVKAGLTNCKVYAIGDDSFAVESLTKKTGTVVRANDTTDDAGLTSTTSAKVNYVEAIAAQIAAQLKGALVGVDGGQLLITSDTVGADSSVAVVVGGNTNLTFAAADDGAGVPGTVVAGTILARTTSGAKPLVPYETSGSSGANEPVAVLPEDVYFETTGTKKLFVLKKGIVSRDQLVKHGDSSAITDTEIDKLVKNTGILALPVTELGKYDNQ